MVLDAQEFDLDSFNAGDYINAIEARRKSEGISHVLYPNDNTYAGEECHSPDFLYHILQRIL